MKRVLIINPFGIGDILFSMTLVEALRQNNKDIFIGFLCNERTEGLVRLNRSIDSYFVFNRDFFRALWRKNPFRCLTEAWKLLFLVRAKRFDTVIDLSLGREYSFFAMLSGIKERIGLDYKNRGVFLTHKIKIAGYEKKPVIETQLELLDYLNIPYEAKKLRPAIDVSNADLLWARAFLEQSHSSASEILVAIAPGGGKSWGRNAKFKQWESQNFSRTANNILSKKNINFLILGDSEEAALLREVASDIQRPSVVVAGESIGKVCALLLCSRFLLCNDGGLMHLADALGIPTLALFGPVDEKVYGPYWKNGGSRVVTEPVPCRPCYQRFHFPPCAHNKRCLDEIYPEKIVVLAEELLGKAGAA